MKSYILFITAFFIKSSSFWGFREYGIQVFSKLRLFRKSSTHPSGYLLLFLQGYGFTLQRFVVAMDCRRSILSSDTVGLSRRLFNRKVHYATVAPMHRCEEGPLVSWGSSRPGWRADPQRPTGTRVKIWLSLNAIKVKSLESGVRTGEETVGQNENGFHLTKLWRTEKRA